MSNEYKELQQIGFNYGVMAMNDAMELKASAERIKVRLKRTADDIIEIGKELIDAKERCGHGNFETWLKSEFELSVDSAQNFMNVAKTFGNQIPNSSVFGLGAKVLYKLSAPSTTEAVRAEIIDRAENGETVTVKEIQAAKKEAAEAKQRAADLQQKNFDLQDAINKEKDSAVQAKQEARQSVERAQMAATNAEGNYKELANRFDHYVTEGVEEKMATITSEQQQHQTIIDNLHAEKNKISRDMDTLKKQHEADIDAKVHQRMTMKGLDIKRLENQIQQEQLELDELKKTREKFDAELGGIMRHDLAINKLTEAMYGAFIAVFDILDDNDFNFEMPDDLLAKWERRKQGMESAVDAINTIIKNLQHRKI